MWFARRGMIASWLLGALLCTRAAGDPLYSWEEFRARSRRREGLFGQWAPDQARVRRTLQSLERRNAAKLAWDAGTPLATEAASPAESEVLARQHLRVGKVAPAERLLRAAVEQDPAARGSRLLLADIYRRCGREDLAAAQLEALARQRPEEREGRERLVGLYERLGRAKDAARVLAEWLRLEPENAAVRRKYVAAVIRAGDRDAADKAVKDLLQADPEAAENQLLLAEYHRSCRQPIDARKVLEGLYGREPKAEVAEMLALVLLRLQEPKAAREALRAWTDRPEADTLLLMAAVASGEDAPSEETGRLCYRLRERGHVAVGSDMLACVWLGRGDTAGIDAVVNAAQEAQRSDLAQYRTLLHALADKPEERKRVAFLLNAATVLYWAGWKEETTDLLRLADRLAPNQPLIGSRMARALPTVSGVEGALALWDKLAKDSPKSVDLAVGCARAHMDAGELDEAERVCRKALAEIGEKSELRVLLADLAARQGRYGEAAAAAGVVLGTEPGHAEAYARLLDARLVLGDLGAIDRAFSARRVGQPSYLPGPFERIVRLEQEEKGQSARVQAQLALAQDPFNWRLQYLAGLLHARAELFADAAAAFDAVYLLRPTLVPARAHRAWLAVRLGEFPLAEALVRELAESAPDEVRAQIGFADLLVGRRRLGEAVSHLERLAPRSADARHEVQARLAWLYLAQGKRAEAAALAERVLGEDAAHARARSAAAEAYRSLGDLKGAVALYERLLASGQKVDLDAELGVLRLLSGPDAMQEAAQRLDRAVATAEAGRRYVLLLCAAAARLGRGDVPKAREAAAQALEARPEGAQPTAELYLLLAVTGEGERAEQELAVIREVRPEIASWLGDAAGRIRQRDPKLATPFVVAYLAARLRWGSTAAGLFEVVRESNPREPAVLYAAATTHLGTGRPGLAMVCAQALVRLRPKSGRAQILLGRVFEGQGQREEAAAAYGRACELIGQKTIPLWFEVAQHLARVKSTDAAVAAYRRILALEPENGRAMNSLAWLYVTERPDRLDEARRLASRAVEVLPESAAVHDTLAWVLFVSGRKADAERHVRRALALAPARAAYHYHLGMIAYAQGKLDAARQALNRALEMDPELSDGDTARATLKLIENARPKS